MKIALLAPIEESVPPKRYGGIETVVYNLAHELHAQGHSVTVFASGDSKVSGELVPLIDKAIGSGRPKRIREALTYEALVKAAQLIAQGNFDVVHNHVGWQALLFKDIFQTPILSTIHWTLDNECESEMYSHYQDMSFVSISDSQRTHGMELNYAATVYHGLDPKLFAYNPHPKDYLAFLGRFSPVKGPVEAIMAAKKTGQQLIMAGKINSFERKFFTEKIQPHIDGTQIKFIGEINRKQTINLLGNAKALLSPIQWDEPFGLTNIEAMACGTPVISMKRGSLPEIVIDGKTGFLCDKNAELIEAINSITKIKRQDCRNHVVNYFSNEIMTQNYINLYKEVAMTLGFIPQLKGALYDTLRKPIGMVNENA